jgi:galactokinase
MTGGGFGGCILALVAAGESDRIGAQIADNFGTAGYGQPAYFRAIPATGAQRIR